MTTLFTADELAAYLMRPVPDAQYRVAHDLTLDAVQGEVGGRISDPPQPGVRSVAMGVAGRVLTNPGGLRAATAGAVSETYSDAMAGVTLTDAELRRLRRAVGLALGAAQLDIDPDYGTSYRGGRW
jgi:hypothetical protein